MDSTENSIILTFMMLTSSLSSLLISHLMDIDIGPRSPLISPQTHAKPSNWVTINNIVFQLLYKQRQPRYLP